MANAVSSPLLLDVLDPTAERVDPKVAAAGVAVIEALPAGVPLTISAPAGRTVELPAAVTHVLAVVLAEAARGRAVAVVARTEEPEVSTSEAARLLGVSRPHVAKLVDLGIIPGRRPGAGQGSHRRIRLAELLAYKRRTETRHAALDTLMAETEELGIYSPPAEQPGPKPREERPRRAVRRN